MSKLLPTQLYFGGYSFQLILHWRCKVGVYDRSRCRPSLGTSMEACFTPATSGKNEIACLELQLLRAFHPCRTLRGRERVPDR